MPDCDADGNRERRSSGVALKPHRLREWRAKYAGFDISCGYFFRIWGNNLHSYGYLMPLEQVDNKKQDG
jgi:hypothetical protein